MEPTAAPLPSALSREGVGALADPSYVEIEGAAHHIWLTHAQELRGALLDAVEYVHEVDAARPR